MKKSLLAIAAIAMATASTAYAAPGLGSSGSTGAVAPGPGPVFSVLASVFSFTEKASGPARDSNSKPQHSPYQCSESEQGDDEKDTGADAKKSASGPEPVYLAF